jgi:hypothetical protein
MIRISEELMAKQIYNSPVIGGEVQIETEPDPANPSRVIVSYSFNGKHITKEQAQDLMDEGRKRDWADGR